jgi:hypothetical protein
MSTILCILCCVCGRQPSDMGDSCVFTMKIEWSRIDHCIHPVFSIDRVTRVLHMANIFYNFAYRGNDFCLI